MTFRIRKVKHIIARLQDTPIIVQFPPSRLQECIASGSVEEGLDVSIGWEGCSPALIRSVELPFELIFEDFVHGFQFGISFPDAEIDGFVVFLVVSD